MSHVRSRRRGQLLDDDHSEGEEAESIAEQSSDAADSSEEGEDSSSDDDSEDGDSISGSESENDGKKESVKDDTQQTQKDKESVNTETNEELTVREKQVLERREYRRKLAEDPSFVPYVGQFWSHDDRYRDDALRPAHDSQPESSAKPERRPQQQQNRNYRRVPDGLINKKWSHDGYEWLLRMEEEDKQRRNGPRRPPRHQQQQRRRRPGKDSANSNWQSFDPAQQRSSWPKLKDTSSDKIVSETDTSNDDWTKKATWNEQDIGDRTKKTNGNGWGAPAVTENGWGNHQAKPESKSEEGWGEVDTVKADTGWGAVSADVAKEDSTGWSSPTPAKSAKVKGSGSSGGSKKVGKGRSPSADATKAKEGWSSAPAPTADTSKANAGWGTAPVADTSKADEGWGDAPVSDTSKTDKGWGDAPTGDTSSKAAEGWGGASTADIPKTDEGWGRAFTANTSKADEGWGDAPATNSSKADEGWGSIDAPKVDAGWGTTDENHANSGSGGTNGVSEGNDWKKAVSWTDTSKTDSPRRKDAPKKDEGASAGWSSWNADRSQRRGRGYLSQKKPAKPKAPEPIEAVYDFETLQNAPWGSTTETDAWSHKKFIEQDDKEDQESDVEIILEAEPDSSKSKAVEDSRQRRMDENWRRRDNDGKDQTVMQEVPPQNAYFYPQAPPMGSYVPMTPAMPHAYGIPLQPVAMPPTSGADASGNAAEEQQYAMPPAFEANGMVYYGVDPSSMYNYYYYQQMPVMMAQQGGEEAENQGWGNTPQYPEEPTDQSQPPAPAGYQYYYPPSYYT